MKTLHKLLYAQIGTAVFFVTVGFLALFAFFDLLGEISGSEAATQSSYAVAHALVYVALLQVAHLYELLPITLLIGAVFVLSGMARHSEFTILRISGLGPQRALRTLLQLGAGFALLTFVIGDYLAAPAQQAAQSYKARFEGGITIGATGAWMKERNGAQQRIANVRQMDADGVMHELRIFELDAQGILTSMIWAQNARFAPTQKPQWILQNVRQVRLLPPPADAALFSGTAAAAQPGVQRQHLRELMWLTSMDRSMVGAALLKPERMSTWELYRYILHLRANKQSAQSYAIEFWRKVFYPLSCIVMVMLALPFAYLHFRSGAITTAVFGGVVAGVSFFLMNNVFGYIGNLNGWQPWLAAAAPGVIYMSLSLLALRLLVWRR